MNKQDLLWVKSTCHIARIWTNEELYQYYTDNTGKRFLKTWEEVFILAAQVLAEPD